MGRSHTLDQEFGETTLRVLRETVLAHATAAGMAEGRALDVMLAVHELAANAVEHGGGTGHLRMSVANRELICQVSDPGPASSGLPSNTPGSQRPGAAVRISPWPYEPGHGLWLVRQIADHISVNRGPAGSQVTVAFTMLQRLRAPRVRGRGRAWRADIGSGTGWHASAARQIAGHAGWLAEACRWSRPAVVVESSSASTSGASTERTTIAAAIADGLRRP